MSDATPDQRPSTSDQPRVPQGAGASEPVPRLRSARVWARRHKRIVWAGLAVAGTLLVGAVLASVFWFEFHKAFIDEEVREEVIDVADPAPASAPEDGVSASTAPPAPVLLSESQLIDVGHEGSGTVQVIENPDGTRVLQLLGLDVSNGPDLRVLLSPTPLTDDRSAYSEGFYDLGELHGNVGDQVYAIPPDVDLSRYQTVAIWCRRFNYTFNAAPITAA